MIRRYTGRGRRCELWIWENRMDRLSPRRFPLLEQYVHTIWKRFRLKCCRSLHRTNFDLQNVHCCFLDWNWNVGLATCLDLLLQTQNHLYLKSLFISRRNLIQNPDLLAHLTKFLLTQNLRDFQRIVEQKRHLLPVSRSFRFLLSVTDPSQIVCLQTHDVGSDACVINGDFRAKIGDTRAVLANKSCRAILR